ncbi:DUF7344 domain-containing protein [Halobacteriaceae archaeon SHR40]|uniref:DUF7344 domain-containing protein n=1 Tax=Halovenus amylolytica TaxID=2500550 RepID=UPI000FE3D932
MNQTDTPAEQLNLPAAVQAELLSARRRCLLLVVLAEGGPATVDDLAVRIRANERGIDPEDVDDAERASARDEIFERHLPKLTATELVEYDSLLGKVRLAEPAIVSLAREELRI